MIVIMNVQKQKGLRSKQYADDPMQVAGLT